MDIKVDGLTYDIVAEALEKCRKGRLFILDEIIKPCIAEPRAELSKYAPKMFSMQIPVDKIKDVIGKGGKVIQEMCANFNCKIDIEEDGHVFISAVDQDDAKRAISHHQDHCGRSRSGRYLQGPRDPPDELWRIC